LLLLSRDLRRRLPDTFVDLVRKLREVLDEEID
jgi:hypothetical protein